MKTSTVTIRVSKDFKEKVKAAALAEGRKVNGYVLAAIKHKLDITDDRTEEQLRADNDAICCNCLHKFPNANECNTCEQPNGPCTTRSNWTFRGIVKS
jgi:uncharacterized protein (DUF1778 family)